MMQYRNEVDLLIKKAIQSEIEDTPPPMPVDKAWEQLEAKLDRQPYRSNRSPFYKNKLIYAVAVILISFIVFISPQTSGAYSKFIEVFQRVQDNVTQLFIKVEDRDSSGSNVAPEDEMYIVEEPEMDSVELGIEEAQKETAFFIKQPKFVPEGYVLKNVTVLKSEIGQSNDIFLHYEGEEGSFEINQKLLEESFSGGVTINNDDAQIDTIDFQGQSASLLHYKNGFIELIWVTESHYYSISSGILSEDQMINIAKSL
ncbi:MAG TPA: DUF4367 domain-containing protein [Candidatus Dormibacteraeota bacterium]|nr:DUF4367 domain-containing protein [Candidatus Dormibacteraeota bacterium]